MMNKFCVVMGLLVLTTGACTSDDEPKAEEDPFAKEEGFCQAVAAATCNAVVVEACYLTDDAKKLEENAKKCLERRSQSKYCNPQGLPYSKTGATACIAAYKEAYKDATLTPKEVASYADACLAVYSKGGKAGSNCAADVECDGAAELRCIVKAGKGTCAKATEVDPGKSCADEGKTCKAGHYCGQDEACIERPGPGKACLVDKPCVETARCEKDVCVAKTENGESCTGAGEDECALGFCVMAPGASAGTCGKLRLSPTASDSCDPFRGT